MQRIARLLSFCGAWLAVGGALAAEPEVAVLDIRGQGVAPELLPTLTEVLTAEIHDTGRYQVVSGSDIEAMLGFERQKDMVGCTEVACLAEIGGALGVERIVASQIGKVGSTYVVNIKLINIRTASPEDRAYKTVKGEVDALIQVIRASVSEIFGGEAERPRPSADSVAAPAKKASEATANAVRRRKQQSPATPATESKASKSSGSETETQQARVTSAREQRGQATIQPDVQSTTTDEATLGVGAAPLALWSAGAALLATGVGLGVTAQASADRAYVFDVGSQRAAERAPKLAIGANVAYGVGGAVALSGFLAWWLSSATSSAVAQQALLPTATTEGVGVVYRRGF